MEALGRTVVFLLLLTATGAVGCAEGEGDASPAVRVGAGVVSRAEVRHWATVLGTGRHPRLDAAIRRQALQRLIAWQWLRSEAVTRALLPAKHDVSRQLTQLDSRLFPGASNERQEFFEQTGETPGDLRQEAEAELLAERLRAAVLRSVPVVSSDEVARYYRQHRQRYAVRERREIRTTNRKSYAQAAAAKRQLEETGPAALPFEKEVRELPKDLSTGARPKLERAIRAAPLGVITGPVKQLAVGTVYDYFVFEVTKVTPAAYRTLAEVRGALTRELTDTARRRALEGYIAAWRARWALRTECSPGYIVQKCSRFRGVRAPEAPLRFE